MTDLIDTTEMYLRTVLELEEEGIVPLRARIAERLGHSGPTVSQTVARMERDGLLIVSADRQLELTEAGRDLATRVMRKHRLAERLLADVIGLDWPQVHEEACRWEHVMSEAVEQRLFELLERPEKSPYGNPIPGLEAFGGEKAETGVGDLQSMVSAACNHGDGPVRFWIKRLAEAVQTDPELLTQLEEGRIMPGEHASITLVGEYVAVEVDGVNGILEIPAEVAEHIFGCEPK
ncbi:metal-dependent transcriptional regulator [Micrococcoides hystricis]|uniref:Metal-dependent transcriptional regulator n=1 Tax=Micrococcoides hystricis TaxID=1572761 RepID=A0ABV6P9N6_9MICC